MGKNDIKNKYVDCSAHTNRDGETEAGRTGHGENQKFETRDDFAVVPVSPEFKQSL